jgi:23S rRNA-/tRNA-specific pseudouridylate synthase
MAVAAAIPAIASAFIAANSRSVSRSSTSSLHMSTVVKVKKGKKIRKIFSFDIPSVMEAATESEVSEALATYQKTMNKMKAKDLTSKVLTKEDLKIVHVDEHVIVVDKPAGVLCVPDKSGNPSLAAAVFEAFGCESGNVDKMVAHRLGFDTTGLVVFARTDKAIKHLNIQVRAQQIVKKYEALVCGSVEQSKGSIDLALTRDVKSLPYVRVYT